MDWEILYYNDEVQTIGDWRVGMPPPIMSVTKRMCAFGPIWECHLQIARRRHIGTMKTHDEMLREWRRDPEFVREYDSLEDEFALFDELLRAHKQAPPQPGSGRADGNAALGGGAVGGRWWSFKTLAFVGDYEKYAEARCGCRLEIKMVRVSTPHDNC